MPQQNNPMNHHHPRNGTCAVTGKTAHLSELIPLNALRSEISERLLKNNPDIEPTALVSRDAVNAARIEYVRDLLQGQLGELSTLDNEVLESLHKHEVLAENPNAEGDEDKSSSLGDKIADKMASFGGSWAFILSFGAFLIFWVGLNGFILMNHAFDPYPFIFLNLMLSCIAALQAPVIMMSQNRQEKRDRKRAESDYKINLKAELEIRHLHDKLDFLMHQQTAKLMEVQQIQLDLMKDMVSSK